MENRKCILILYNGSSKFLVLVPLVLISQQCLRLVISFGYHSGVTNHRNEMQIIYTTGVSDGLNCAQI